MLDENLQVLAAATDVFQPVETQNNADIFVAANLTPDDIRKPILKSTEFKTREGAEMLGTYRTLPTQRWVVAVRRPLSKADSTLVASKNAFLPVLAVSASSVDRDWLLAKTWIRRHMTRRGRST